MKSLSFDRLEEKAGQTCRERFSAAIFNLSMAASFPPVKPMLTPSHSR